MDESYLVAVIAVMAVTTFLTRILPFALLGKWRDAPALNFIGRYLPLMTMPLLVIYALKPNLVNPVNYGVAEMAAVSTVVVLHLAKRNALLSIGIGTTVYIMVTGTLTHL